MKLVDLHLGVFFDFKSILNTNLDNLRRFFGGSTKVTFLGIYWLKFNEIINLYYLMYGMIIAS